MKHIVIEVKQDPILLLGHKCKDLIPPIYGQLELRETEGYIPMNRPYCVRCKKFVHHGQIVMPQWNQESRVLALLLEISKKYKRD